MEVGKHIVSACHSESFFFLHDFMESSQQPFVEVPFLSPLRSKLKVIGLLCVSQSWDLNTSLNSDFLHQPRFHNELGDLRRWVISKAIQSILSSLAGLKPDSLQKIITKHLKLKLERRQVKYHYPFHSLSQFPEGCVGFAYLLVSNPSHSLAKYLTTVC